MTAWADVIYAVVESGNPFIYGVNTYTSGRYCCMVGDLGGVYPLVINASYGDDQICLVDDDLLGCSDNDGSGNPEEWAEDTTIYGEDGDDTIITASGPYVDVVYGGDDRDKIHTFAGYDDIYGGDGPDIIYAGPGEDYVDGGSGADDIYGGTAQDTIDGGDGDDTIYGGPGDDIINGEGGDDVIQGEAGGDSLCGGDLEDRIFGGADIDCLCGGDGANGNNDGDYDVLQANDPVNVNEECQYWGSDGYLSGCDTATAVVACTCGC